MSVLEKFGLLVVCLLFALVWVHIFADIVAPARRTKLREPQWWFWDGARWHYVKDHDRVI